MAQAARHWNNIYRRSAPTTLSWYEPEARTSLELFSATGLSLDAAVIDVGAGSSTLVNGLLARGYSDITLLDVSASALAETRARLGSRAEASVELIVDDITSWFPRCHYAAWHDRATFHFLTHEADRTWYRAALAASLLQGAHAIIGAFALDGAEQCSGLPVRRYSAESLALEFHGLLEPMEHRTTVHATPTGIEQPFVFVRFVRT